MARSHWAKAHLPQGACCAPRQRKHLAGRWSSELMPPSRGQSSVVHFVAGPSKLAHLLFPSLQALALPCKTRPSHQKTGLPPLKGSRDHPFKHTRALTAPAAPKGTLVSGAQLFFLLVRWPWCHAAGPSFALQNKAFSPKNRAGTSQRQQRPSIQAHQSPHCPCSPQGCVGFWCPAFLPSGALALAPCSRP